ALKLLNTGVFEHRFRLSWVAEFLDDVLHNLCCLWLMSEPNGSRTYPSPHNRLEISPKGLQSSS
ncbi:hypothetical protein, partial [Vibrio parahaemolyticus]|uniref:hypothetical protein n=1 Tax=Vibrio parahaemolyticus TaxID=670 RepID=UPI0022B314F3